MNLRIELSQHLAFDDSDFLDRVVHFEQVYKRQPECLQKNRRRHFPPAVDPHIENVSRVELEVEPRSAIGDDSGGIQHLTAGVSTALIVREGGAGGSMQLADHYTFRTVHDKGSPFLSLIHISEP